VEAVEQAEFGEGHDGDERGGEDIGAGGGHAGDLFAGVEGERADFVEEVV